MDIKDVLLLRDWLNFVAEWVIVYILVLEYHYDRNWNEHLKRQKRKAKEKMAFESLTEGESR